MRKDITRSIEIPEGISVEVKIPKIIVKGNGKELEKKIPYSKNLEIVNEENKIKINGKNPSRRETALAGTTEAHIRNLIQGVKEGFVYKLEICNVHFPMNVKIEGNKIIIKNFLGEKKDRVAKLNKDVEATMKGNIIELKSIDVESVGQSAANIEKATKGGRRDRRVFQDGIYIIEKAGEAI